MSISGILLGCKVPLILLMAISVLPIASGQELISSVSGSNFRLSEPYTVTMIQVSHSVSGQSGRISLVDQSGNGYGPWHADTSSSTWVVYPDVYLMAGSYRLVDSDPNTYEGEAWIYGYFEQPPDPEDTTTEPDPGVTTPPDRPGRTRPGR